MIRRVAQVLALTAALCALSLEPAHARPGSGMTTAADEAYEPPGWSVFAGVTAHGSLSLPLFGGPR